VKRGQLPTQINTVKEHSMKEHPEEDMDEEDMDNKRRDPVAVELDVIHEIRALQTRMIEMLRECLRRGDSIPSRLIAFLAWCGEIELDYWKSVDSKICPLKSSKATPE
jgi:hypothetical protein